MFAGHGGQWTGMGLGLLSRSEAFRTELTRIDEAVERHAGWSVLNVLRAPEEFSPLDRTEYLQPVLFAVNAALAAAWRELGVTPDAVVGHSLGEMAAAYSAGALTLDEAVTAVTARAAAVVPHVGHGGMLAVELPPADVEDLLAPYAGRLFVGAVNGPAATAVSGESEALGALRRHLEERGVPARVLSTPFASHTPLMEPLRAELLDRFSGIRGCWTTATAISWNSARTPRSPRRSRRSRPKPRSPRPRSAHCTAAGTAGTSSSAGWESCTRPGTRPTGRRSSRTAAAPACPPTPSPANATGSPPSEPAPPPAHRCSAPTSRPATNPAGTSSRARST